MINPRRREPEIILLQNEAVLETDVRRLDYLTLDYLMLFPEMPRMSTNFEGICQREPTTEDEGFRVHINCHNFAFAYSANDTRPTLTAL